MHPIHSSPTQLLNPTSVTAATRLKNISYLKIHITTQEDDNIRSKVWNTTVAISLQTCFNNMHFKCVCGHSDLDCYYGHRDLNTPKKITKAEGHCSDSTPTHMNNK